MDEGRMVFGPRRPVVVLVVGGIAILVAVGAMFLPQGSNGGSGSTAISPAVIAGIAGLLVLAILIAYLISWAIVRKMLIEVDGTTIHAVSREPKGDWTFDASRVVEVVRARNRNGGPGVNVLVRLRPVGDEPNGRDTGAWLPTAYVGRRGQAERAVLDVIRRAAPGVIVPDKITLVGAMNWWAALPR